ncbi:DUF2169 domain-containing protein [Variovorax sp. Root411]|uniref:DUF2169 family type VI secretion system accessory protein n=1 Tax=Variovorax sp. Root411 TaxID=1736530 RepID=UPI0006FDF84B|nr:DUF2169 domain-containing protein [Variovorax sp. Root411]KQW59535.1 hypothetical protein ASC92_07920 [Variovorax sp. Root411]
MKTVKPFRLSTLTRPYRWQGRDMLGVSVLGLVSLEAQPMLLPEQELWQLAAEEIGPGNVLDLGVPKLVPEMLVSGRAYTAHQQDKTICAVKVRLAEREKALTVSGDRFWLDGRATAPQPFDSMRIDWAHAYGGPDLAENPQGMGRVDEMVNGVAVRRVPNVEAPDARMASRGQHVRPASMGAIPPDWPQRMRLLGTAYGPQWLQEQYPGFADDMDWRFFNAAPSDQRWPDAGELPAGASYEIWNMHPTEPVLRGVLPRWRARCFASWHKDGGELQEAMLRLTTAWLFPHVRRAILIWHGSFAITEDDAADMKHLMPALELETESRPLSHYESVLRLRLDPETAIHAVRDSDLVPKAVMGAWAADQMPDVSSRPMVRNQRAGQLRDYEMRRARLESEGLDPAKFLPTPVLLEGTLQLEDLPEYSARAEQKISQARDELKARSEKAMAELGVEVPDPTEATGRRRFDPDQMIEELARIEEFGRQGRLEGVEEAAQARERMVSQIRQGHLYTAHLLDPAPAMTTFRAAKLRRRLGAAEPGQRRFAGANLVGADLSNMDLSGADFSGANLEDANLAGARLDGCDFTRAVLARARLERATLTSARLDHANLGGAQCDGANFGGASLRHANCHKTVFRVCVLTDVEFEATNTHESVWQQCDLRRSRWQQVAMMKMTLEDVSFDGAQFRQMGWIECTLKGVSFAHAAMTSCGFVAISGSEGIDFTGATFAACSFSSDSMLAGAVFRDAAFKHCGLRGVALTGADLSGARLEGCDFSGCDLRRARLDRLNGGESLFVRADFSGASLVDANFIDANLSKADLRMTDFHNANLFRADVSQATIDGSTRLDSAYTHNAKVWPARRAQTTR